MAKLRSGQVNFDVFFPTIDVMGQLVEGKFIQPLNHSYIPNISQAWPDFTNPFYDRKWQYTVPYTIYTTGMAWRKDHVPENPYKMANPWAMPWQGKYKGKVAILDDSREGISLGLMKNGIFDLNTTDPNQIAASAKTLQDLAKLTNMHIDNNDYTDIPKGSTWIHHAWSGYIAAAQYYMPKGTSVDVVGYWFPPDGKGPVGNDLITILKGAQNPVLAHLFLDYMLDLHNTLENISFNGYMQPLTKVTPQLMVKEKLLPPNLMSTAVLPSYFRRGVMELQLPVTALTQWSQAWLQVKSA
jgi:spermidine/putrescine transport system substrate-binding protein